MDLKPDSTTKGNQAIQADQYVFPYHYIPEPRGNLYLSRHWGFAPSYMAALKLVAECLRPAAAVEGTGWRHIDIGCGDGALIYNLSRLPGLADGQIAGVDIDDRAIAWARMFNPDAILHVGDITTLEGSYHSASLVEVLEHVPPAELPEFISAAAGLLRPGGLLVVTVPSVEKPVAKKHFQHFSFESIRAVLEPHFEELKVLGFERHDAVTQTVAHLRMNPWMRIDAPMLNRMAVARLKRIHATQRGCGRILANGRRKEN